MKTTLILIISIFLFQISKAQHTVTVKKGNMTFAISGDTTTYDFKSIWAKYEDRFSDAAKYKVKAVEAGEITNKGTGYYDAACFFALSGEKVNAIRYLSKSLTNGYSDIGALDHNLDLISIKGSEEWKSTINPHIEDYYKKNNRELAKMFAEDQAERKSGKINPENDSLRIGRVKEMIEMKEIVSSDDFYKAAFIFHHGKNTDHYEKAHYLANKALQFKDHHNMAPWLYAATKDRYLLSKDEPQWFGTQAQEFLPEISDFGIAPQRIDTTAVDESSRDKYNAPSISEIRKWIKNYEKVKNESEN